MNDGTVFGMSTQERKDATEARKRYYALKPEERFVFRLKNKELEEEEGLEYVIAANHLAPLARILEPERTDDEIIEKLEHGMKDQAPENALKLAQEIILKTIEHGEIIEALKAAKEIDLITEKVKNAVREKYISMVGAMPKDKWPEMEELYNEIESRYSIKIKFPAFNDQMMANILRPILQDKKYLKTGGIANRIIGFGIGETLKENQPNLFQSITNAVRKDLRVHYLPILEKERKYSTFSRSDETVQKMVEKLLKLGILTQEEDKELIEKLKVKK